jgi:iron complex outermembrane receptor protein
MAALRFAILLLLSVLSSARVNALPLSQTPGAGAVNPAATQRGNRQAGTSTLVGLVTAPDDARLPGVTITIRNLATGSSLVIVTAGHGGYSASSLGAGDYEIKAELQGFETQVAERVTLAAGETKEVNFRLPLNSLSETVTVVAAVVKNSIEASEIRESTARDIGEALGQMNGIAKVRKGAIGNDVVLNGFQSRNLTVLIDGERIYGACPNGMDPAVFHADFAEVDHLEVGKGPFDVRHTGSLGGVINVVTKPPNKGLHANLNLAGGSFGLINPSATVSLGTDTVSVLGGFSYRTANPYRDGSGTLFTQYANYRPDTVGSSAYAANTRWARLYVSPRPHQSVQVAYTQQRTSHIVYPYLQMDGVSDDADRANLGYDIIREQARVERISARAYYTRVRHWMTDALRVSSIGAAREYSMATQADTTTFGGSVEIVLGRVTTGVEIFRRKWDATTVMAGSKYAPQYGIPFVAIDTAGGFVEYQRPLAAATRLEVGGRFDWSRSTEDPIKANTDLYLAYKGTRATSSTDTGTSGKIRLIHRAKANLEVETGLGHTVRVPDPQERYFALKRAGNDWVGNPALQPTGNTGVNLGVNYRVRRIMASIGVYHDRLTNFITVQEQRKINTVAGVMNTLARSYENVDARMTSGEISLTYPLTDRLFASASASYTRGTKATDPARGITNPNIAEIHPVMGSLNLRYDRAVAFAEAQWIFSGRHVYVDTDLQEEPMPGYGLLNLHVGGQRKNIRVTFALDNVFNLLYVDHMSYQRDPFRLGVRVREPGRNLYTNVSYRF